MDVAFLVPEIHETMMTRAGRRFASSVPLIVRVLLVQLGLTVVVAVLFWGTNGYVSAYSATLGGLTCVVPNAHLALRLVAPRRDPGAGALTRAAYIGELGKLALTVIMFCMIFALVRPLSAPALFTGFIAAQLATLGGLLMRDAAKGVGTDKKNGE